MSRSTPAAPVFRASPAPPRAEAGLHRVNLEQIATAAAGGLLVLAVVLAALTGLARIGRAGRAVAGTVAAERSHQDADMAHDALHADVLGLLARPDRSGRQLDRLRLDADRHRGAVQAVARLRLSAPLASELAELRGGQNGYIAQAELLGRLAAADPAAARRAEPAFEAAFDQLTVPQAQATDALAAAVRSELAEAERQRVDARNLVLLAALVGLVTLLVVTFWLVRLGTRLAFAARQRAVAETLQRSLLPARLPRCSGLELAACYRPVSSGAQVGGDWYDAFLLPGDALGLVIGDVAGHDAAAATVMGQLRTVVQAYALEGHPPAKVLRLANDLALQLTAVDLATCLFVVLDPDRANLRVANAGHHPPLLTNPAGPGRFLDHPPPGPPLGTIPDPSYVETRHQLPAAFRLLLFTDGLVERRGIDLDDGLRRLGAC